MADSTKQTTGIGAAPPGATQNPDGSWTTSPAATSIPAIQTGYEAADGSMTPGGTQPTAPATSPATPTPAPTSAPAPTTGIGMAPPGATQNPDGSWTMGGSSGGTGTQATNPSFPTLPQGQFPVPTPQAIQQPTPVQAPTYQTYSYQAYNPTPPAGLDQSSQAFAQVLAMAQPNNTAGLKEQQKESLSAIQQQQLDQLHTNAALRGTSAGGETAALENQIGDQFAGDLTKSYRDIDNNAQQQEIANLLAGGQAEQSLQGQKFGQEMSADQFGLTQQQAQAGENEQSFQDLLASAGIGLQNNSQSLAGQQLSLAQLLGLGNLNLGQQGAANSLTLGQGQQGLTAEQIANQNEQFYKQLAQQNTQFGATLDSNQQQAFWNAIMGLLQ